MNSALIADTRWDDGGEMNKSYALLVSFGLLTACNSSDFKTSAAKPPKASADAAGEGVNGSAPGDDTPQSGTNGESVGGRAPSGGAVSVEELGQGRVKANFSYGPKSAKADFLFVFDNSSSMKDAVDNMKLGFDSLSSAKWPADTVIGVMTTMPGNPANLNEVHPAVNRYASIEKEPGFLSLMSETARSNFRSANSSMGDRLPEAMCQQEWFKPSDKSSSGKSCLSAAVQSAFSSVGVEAGLVAVSQILDKRNQFFRVNSNVHVVFVSDTQDPGKNPNNNSNVRALYDLRPMYANLKSKIIANSSVSGVKLHGVTPSLECRKAEKDVQELNETPYQVAIAQSGGTWLDFCDGDSARTNYVPVAEQIVANTLPEPVFVLPESVKNIESVEVAGQPVELSLVTLVDGNTAVRIEGLSPSSDVAVTIIYQR
jgi:hypothetical protein